MICPNGFLFLWIPKCFMQEVWQIVREQWDYKYIETLNFVFLKPNGKIGIEENNKNIEALNKNAYFNTNHLTLYIFRRKRNEIDIRNQRSPDVIFDCLKANGEFKVPERVYETIETLLPGNNGKFLEIWSDDDRHRVGWTSIFELDIHH